jgi:hypothetical protein
MLHDGIDENIFPVRCAKGHVYSCHSWRLLRVGSSKLPAYELNLIYIHEVQGPSKS